MLKVLPRKQMRRRLKGKYSDKLYYIIISVDSLEQKRCKASYFMCVILISFFACNKHISLAMLRARN